MGDPESSWLLAVLSVMVIMASCGVNQLMEDSLFHMSFSFSLVSPSVTIALASSKYLNLKNSTISFGRRHAVEIIFLKKVGHFKNDMNSLYYFWKQL